MNDASTAINAAISGAPAGSGVIFFPAGCYLIKSQLIDTNSSAHLAYLAEGNVELQADATTPPSNSIIQFGNNSTTVSLRKIENLYFNCNGKSIDGIDLDGLIDSEFDGVSILSCHGTAHMRTTGTNVNNYSNSFFGGLIAADADGENGIQLSVTATISANACSFFGTKILGVGTTATSGTGLDFEGTGGGFYGGVVSGWATGINLAVTNNNGSTPPQLGGFTVSGAYLENNTFYGVRAGNAGGLGEKAVVSPLPGITSTATISHTQSESSSNKLSDSLSQATEFGNAQQMRCEEPQTPRTKARTVASSERTSSREASPSCFRAAPTLSQMGLQLSLQITLSPVRMLGST